MGQISLRVPKRAVVEQQRDVAGALEEREFIALLTEVGFENPSIEPTRIYTREDALSLLQGTGLDLTLANEVQGKIMSGFVRATKPGAASTHPARTTCSP